MKSEPQNRQSCEDKLVREVKALKECLDDLSREKARIDRDYDELREKHKDLLSKQKKMMVEAFSFIMTEVWSMNSELMVPRVERYVNKAVILKAIEDRKKSSPTQSVSPSGSLGVPNVPQQMPASDGPGLAVRVPGTPESFVDRPLEKDEGDDVPPSA